MNKKILFLGILLLFGFIGVNGAVITAATSGPWNVGSTWIGGSPPLAGDGANIPVGITVTLTTNGGNLNTLNVTGVLNVSSNGSLNVSAPVTLVNTGRINNSGNITMSRIDGNSINSTFVNASNGYVNYTGTVTPFSTNGTLISSATGNTFEYSNSILTPVVGSEGFVLNTTYYHLKFTSGNNFMCDGASQLVLGNLSIVGAGTNILVDPNDGGGNLTVAGNIMGNGNLELRNGFNNDLYIGGDYLNTGSLTMNNGGAVRYYATGPQLIKAGFYDTDLILTGGSKTMLGDVKVYCSTGCTGAGSFTNNASSLIFPSGGYSLLSITGVYSGSGTIDMSPGGGEGNVFEMNGNIASCFNLISGNGEVKYNSATVQTICGGIYYGLTIGNGVSNTIKKLIADITVIDNLNLDQSILSLNGFNLRIDYNGYINPAKPFGAFNKIAFTLNGTNKVYIYGNSANQFTNRFVPIGFETAGNYAPVTINTLAGSVLANSSIGIRPISTTLGAPYLSRMYDVVSSGISAITAFDASFGFMSTETVSGVPGRANRDVGGVVSSIPGVTITFSGANGVAGQGAFAVHPPNNQIDGKYFLQGNGPAFFRSNGAFVSWATATSWQQSFNNGVTWNTASNVPGQYVPGDIVSVTSANVVTSGGSPVFPLKSLTVSGTLNHNSGSIIVAGNTLINNNGGLNITGANTLAQFQGNVLVNSILGVTAGNTAEFQNGLINNFANNINGNILFSTNNQTLGGTALANFSGGNVSVTGPIILAQKTAQTFYGKVTGTLPSSTLELGGGSLAVTLNPAEPMKIGNLVATATGCTFQYNSGGSIKATDYYNLSVFTTNATLTGNTRVMSNYSGSSMLIFPLTATSLSVGGSMIDGSSLLGIDMSTGNVGHVLSVAGNFATGNLQAGSGTVVYGGTGNQNIRGGVNYYKLEIKGGGIKSLSPGAITVANSLYMNGAILKGINQVVAMNNGASIVPSVSFGPTNYLALNNAGGLRLDLNNGLQDVIFPIGTDAGYAPMTLKGVNFASPGSVTVLSEELASNVYDNTKALSRQWKVNTSIDNLYSGGNSIFQYAPADQNSIPAISLTGINGAYMVPPYPPVNNFFVVGTVDGVNRVINIANAPSLSSYVYYTAGLPQAFVPSPKLYRTNGSSTVWSNTTAWDYWNGATWVSPAPSYPGQSIPGDDVWIAPSHTINLDIDPQAINSLTVSGTFGVNNSSITILGVTTVTSVGNILDNAASGKITFNGLVGCDGSLDFSAGNGVGEFHQGIIHNGTSFQSLRAIFANNSQTISGTGSMSFNNITVAGAIDVYINRPSVLPIYINGILDANNTAGSITLGTNSGLQYQPAVPQMPMRTGSLNCTASGSVFSYAGNNDQDIRPGIYYHLNLSGSGGNKILLNSTTVLGNYNLISSGMIYVNTVSSTLIVNGDYHVNASAVFNMNAAGFNTLLKLKGANNTFLGTFVPSAAANSLISYEGAVQQSVFGTTELSDLEFLGGRKVLTAHVQANNSIKLSGALIDIKDYNLTLGPAATFVSGAPYDNTNMILTTSTGLAIKQFNIGVTTFAGVFPVGTDAIYSPLSLLTSNQVPNPGNFLAVRAVAQPAPDIFMAGKALNRFWVITSVGIGSVTSTLTGLYNDPSDIPGTSSEALYVPANGFLPYQWAIAPGFVNQVANTTNFLFSLRGAYTSYLTAGEPQAFVNNGDNFRSINSGDWNDFTIWQVSQDNGGNWFSATPGQYPGATVNTNVVSISGGNIVSVAGALLPLASLTVSGVLSVTASNMTISGKTLIANNGNLILKAGQYMLFKDELRMNDKLDYYFPQSGSITELQNGIVLNSSVSGSNVIINGNLLYTTNNQTFSGIQGFPQFNGNITVAGAITVTDAHSGASGNVSYVGVLNGTNSLSTYAFTSGKYINYSNIKMPMETGMLDVSATGCSFVYVGPANQVIKTNTFYNKINFYGGSIAQTRLLTGKIDVQYFDIGGSSIVFVPTTPGVISITGQIAAYGTPNFLIDMQGNQSHKLIIEGYSTDPTGLITVSSGVGSKVIYRRNSDQDILRGSYYDLLVDGTGKRTLGDDLSIANGLSITGAATLDCRQYQITGNASGNFRMDAGTTMILGDPLITTTGPSYPTNFTNNLLDVNSTIVYSAGNTQILPQEAPYFGNLVIDKPGIVRYDNSGGAPITVTGNLHVASGSFQISDYSLPFRVMGNTTVDGLLNFNSIYSSNVNDFFGDVYANGLMLLDGNSMKNQIEIHGNLKGTGIVSITGSATSYLNLYGSDNTLNNLQVQGSPYVNYLGIADQQVIPANYGRLGMGGNSEKILAADTKVRDILSLSGAVLALGAHDLTVAGAFVAGSAYGPTNMIRMEGTSTAGTLFLETQNSTSDLITGYPIGTGNIFSPLTITSFNPLSIGDQSISIQIITATGGTGRVNRFFKLGSSNLGASFLDFSANFGYSSSDAVGATPSSLLLYNPSLNILPGGTVNPAGLSFAHTGPLSSALDGLWMAATPFPTLVGVNIPGKHLCIGDNIPVTLSGFGTFDLGNTFNIEISDATGNFPGTILKTISSQDPNQVSAISVPGIAAGTTYLLRAVSSSPATTILSSFVYTVSGAPVVTSFSPLKVFGGDILTINGQNLGDANAVVFGTTSTITAINIINSSKIEITMPVTTYKGQIQAVNGCGFGANSFQVLTVWPVHATNVIINSGGGNVISTLGGNLQFTGSTTPTNASQEIFYTTSPTAVATINGTGLLQAVADGVVTVTGYSVSDPNVFATFVVSVTGQIPTVSGITVTTAGVNVPPQINTLNGSLQLVATAQPTGANQNVNWFSSNLSIATVSGSGVVTALSNGIVNITAISTSNSTALNSLAVTITGQPIIIPGIFISSTTGKAYCVGKRMTVPFRISGLTVALSQLSAFISNDNFTTQYQIGSTISATLGVNNYTISGFLPATLIGNNFVLKVTSTGILPPDNVGTYAGISIHGIPVVNTLTTQNICSGDIANIPLSSDVPSSIFTWDPISSSPPGAVSGFGVGTGLAISDQLNALGSGTVTYKITADANGCTSSPEFVNVNVNALPTVNNPGSQALCSGSNLIVPLSGSIPSTLYYYSVVSTVGTSLQGYYDNVGNINQTISGSGILVYRIIPVLNNCTGAGVDMIVNVIDKADTTLNVSTNFSAVCVGTPVVVSIDNSQIGVSYSPRVNNSAKNIQVSGTGGTITMTLTDTELSLGYDTIAIMASPNNCLSRLIKMKPVVIVSTTPDNTKQVTISNTEVCQGSDAIVTITNPDPGTLYSAFVSNLQVSPTVSGSSLTLDIPILTDLITGPNNNTINIKAFAPGCSQGLNLANTVDLLVNAIPIVNPVLDKEICAGNQVNIPLSATPSNASLIWTVSGVTGSVTGYAGGTGLFIPDILNGSGTVDYLISPKISFCSGNTFKVTVTVSGLPDVTKLANGDSVCNGKPGLIRIYNSEVGVNYLVYFSGQFINSTTGNGDLANIVIRPDLLSPGFNTFNLQASKPGCSIQNFNQNPAIAVVSPPAIPNITSDILPGSVCDKLNLSLSANPGYYKYQWRYNDIKIAGENNQTYVPVSGGVYSVDVFAASNCFSTSQPSTIILTSTISQPTITALGGEKDTMLQCSIASTYQWYVGNRAIVGANAQFYKPLYKASYRVRVNAEDKCSQYSENYQLNNTDFDDLVRYQFDMTDSTIAIEPRFNFIDRLDVFPNPSKSGINISYKPVNLPSTLHISLVNAMGIAVLQQKIDAGTNVSLQMERENLPSGIYKLIINEGGQIMVKSVILY